MMFQPKVDRLLATAIELVEETGRIALSRFRQPLTPNNKTNDGRFDPVTMVDRGIERFLRIELDRRFPSDGALGEEEPPRSGRGNRQWVLNPIDGTWSLLCDATGWAILLGLLVDGVPVPGVAHQPFLGETLAAAREVGWLDRGGKRIPLRARATTELSSAILCTTDPDRFRAPGERATFDHLSRHCHATRYAGDCYSYCLLALGLTDLVVDGALESHDIAPLVPLLEAAGAVVTTATGSAAAGGGTIVAAATPSLHREALAVLAPIALRPS